MATIKYKPTTPARRNMSVPDFAEITKFTPEKSRSEEHTSELQSR